MPESKKISFQFLNYNPEQYKQVTDTELAIVTNEIDQKKVNWLDITLEAPSQEFQQVFEHFGLHNLTIENMYDQDVLAKVEPFENYSFIVFPVFSYDTHQKKFLSYNIYLTLGKHYLFTAHQKATSVFQPIQDRITQGLGRVRKKGVDYLLYLLMNTIVEYNQIILEEFREDLEDLEEALILRVSQDLVQQIVSLKKELSHFRKMLFPMKDVVNKLKQDDLVTLDKKNQAYFRNLYDQVLEMEQTYQSLKDMLAYFMDLYVSGLSQNMNTIMKTLTMITTIFIPMSFIAGFYGMNFKHMPELNHPWAYPIAIVAMIGCGLGMFFYMKGRKWF